MLSNLIKIAFRNISRQKGFAALNVVGLGVGVAAVLLIFQIVQYELSFNKNFKNYDRIVRVVGERTNPESGRFFLSGMATSAMLSVQNTVPQLQASSRIRLYRPTIIVPDTAGGAPLKKMDVPLDGVSLFAEPALFQVFDFEWLSGDRTTALKAPNSAVLSRKMAETCFDRWENALGRTLLLNNTPMTVRGIIQDAPANCDMPLQLVMSYRTILDELEKYDYVENWGRNRGNDQLFGLLSRADQFEAADLAVGQVGKKEYAAAANSRQIGENTHFLQALADLHYDDRFGTPGGLLTTKSRLWVLASIGLLVLLMACFNFVNLSTAQALQRAREVGVRKTLGSSRSVLVAQFLSETALIVLSAVGLGALLGELALPVLQQISSLP